MAATRITIRNNGSIRVEGDFEILDPEGKAFGLAGQTAVSLCRCGHSSNKPFCDGTHKKIGFQDQVQARDLPPPQTKPAS
ncbi:MAG: iron-binding protein [Acidobacteria bacterium]|nr:MAG: iron-binding protein [Acidobacteriota bacterium]